VLVFLLWPRSAHAYLDANTGSLLLQVLLGGAAGLVVVFKLFWHRTARFFGAGKDQEEQNES